MTTEPKHTPEPWVPAKPNEPWVLLSLPDYARAMACVNACAGIPTAQLQAGCVERLVKTAALLLKTAQHFERQSGRGVSSRRGGTVWAKARATLAPFQDKPE